MIKCSSLEDEFVSPPLLSVPSKLFRKFVFMCFLFSLRIPCVKAFKSKSPQDLLEIPDVSMTCKATSCGLENTKCLTLWNAQAPLVSFKKIIGTINQCDLVKTKILPSTWVSLVLISHSVYNSSGACSCSTARLELMTP